MASAKMSVRWVVAVCVLVACCAVSVPAYASSPWWSLYSGARPANLPPGGEGLIVARAVNAGDAASTGSVTLSDTLPAGVSAQSVSFYAFALGLGKTDLSGIPGACETTPGRVQCVYPGEPSGFLPVVNPYEYIEMRIAVKVAGNAVSGGNRVQATGGGATGASLEHPVVVDGAPTPFGVEDLRFVPEEE